MKARMRMATGPGQFQERGDHTTVKAACWTGAVHGEDGLVIPGVLRPAAPAVLALLWDKRMKGEGAMAEKKSPEQVCAMLLEHTQSHDRGSTAHPSLNITFLRFIQAVACGFKLFILLARLAFHRDNNIPFQCPWTFSWLPVWDCYKESCYDS